jgi:hypothetical protein
MPKETILSILPYTTAAKSAAGMEEVPLSHARRVQAKVGV